MNPKPNRAPRSRPASDEADGTQPTGEHAEAVAATPPSDDRPDAVRVRGVSKSFGRTSVLRGVDLDVPAGGITAVLGPSGSGKTTLLRILAGFEHADAGTVRLGGALVDGSPDDASLSGDDGDGTAASTAANPNSAQDRKRPRRGRSVPPERRRIGYVPQDGALFPHLTVARNIGFALGGSILGGSILDRGRGRELRRARIERLLELTDLVGLGHRYPHELSGGQQQRAALARALAHEPAVVLLDEPFSALDAALRATVREQVVGVLRATGTAGVLVTHDQDEALSTADRVAVLRDGVVAQHGPAQELYDSPADAMVAGFLGEANLVAGELHADGTVQAGPFGAVPLRALSSEVATATADGAVPGSCAATVLVRPEQLKVVTVDEAGAVRAVIERREYFGHDAVLTVRPEYPAGSGTLPERLRVRVADESASDPHLSPGSVISLCVGGPVTAWSAGSH